MGIKKKILSGHTLAAWNYETGETNNGQAIGIFNKDKHCSEAIVLVDAVSGDEGVKLSIMIDEHLAKEYGIEIVLMKEIHPDHKYTFETEDSDLKKYNGTEVLVLRRLTNAECDIEDVGNMFRVCFNDGFEHDVFEDELVS